jgi:hypothetical protein
MITLTTPASINSVLGGNTLVNYDKLVITPFTMDPLTGVINAAVRLTSTGTPSMQPITGSMRVNIPANELIIEVTQIDFFRRVALSAGNITALNNLMESALAQIENGLVSLGVISGTRSAGV